MSNREAVRSGCALSPNTVTPALTCEACGFDGSSVEDTRLTGSGHLRRRRECKACGVRWTTIEVRAEFIAGAERMMDAARDWVGLP